MNYKLINLINRYEYYETIAYIEIIKQKYNTPLWIYIVSIVAGILILLIFVYILKKVKIVNNG